MNKYIYGSLVIAMVAVLGISVVFASGADGFGALGKKGFMKSQLSEGDKVAMQEQREAYKVAVESGDYASWEALMLNKVSEMEDKINQETFDEIVAKHAKRAEFREAVKELKASGDFSREAMQELRVEYGIEDKGFGGMRGRGMHNGFGEGKFGGCGHDMKESCGSCPFAQE